MAATIFTESIINEDGEFKQKRWVKKSVARDKFGILYMEHIADLAKLPKCEHQLLNCLYPLAGYDTNEISLGAKEMQHLLSCSGLKQSTIYTSLTRLVKKNFLQRLGRGWFRLNPTIFWTGSEIARAEYLESSYKWELK